MVSSFNLRVFGPVVVIGMIALALIILAGFDLSESNRVIAGKLLQVAEGAGTTGVVDAPAGSTVHQHLRALIEEQDATSKRSLYLLSTALFSGFAMAIAWLVFCGTSVQRRILAVPERLEHAVFQNKATLDSGRNSGDPVDALTARLLGFTDRVRSKLRASERAERMAFADALTGLPNRRGLLAFLDMLAEEEEAREGKTRIGLIHLDLDHFKAVNDTMGHDAGDTVLREATRRMSTAIRDSDLLARLGGDEFLIVATGVETESDLTCIADRLLSMFESPIRYAHRLCHVGVSMGIVLGGKRGPVRDPKRLLINADMALFRAKSEGRGRYSVFTSSMAEESRRRNERTIALGKALHSEAFHPWFQPMFDCATGDVVGLEVLARWHDPERGILMPQDFMEDAEAASMMEDIGLQVLARALEAVRNWRDSAISPPPVHLNMSRTQLLSASFVDRFSWALDNACIDPDLIAVEIDERTCTARGCEVAFANVCRLHQMGMHVVLDNFGADRAALANIGATRATMIKCGVRVFDGLFAGESTLNREDALAALQAAACAFDVRIAAKDVEDACHSAALLDGGICVQQGGFLAAVMNIPDTTRFLQAAGQHRPRLAGAAR